jgi:isoquinoline 1-oxidoreductase subunit beta
MAPVVRIRRRSLLVGLGAGLAIGIARADEPSGKAGPPPSPASNAVEQTASGLNPNVMVHVALDGMVTIVCHRSEMGQGVRSSIPVLIGDEIGADPARVHVHQAPGDKKYGDQNTDGSSSIRKHYDELRQAGAAVRLMLCEAAAKRWGVKPGTCTTEKHRVVHPPTKRSLPFEDVIAAAAKLPVPKKEAIVLRPASELTTVALEKLPLLDGDAYVTGKAVFGADVRLPGMLVAVIARPPVVGGTVRKHDEKRALAVPGVKRVVTMPAAKPPWKFQPWGGVAVVADNTWAALKGRAALAIDWERGAEAAYSSAAFKNEMLASVRGIGTRFRDKGDVDAAFGRVKKIVEAEYLVPHLSHLQMEPLVATARVENGRAEIWAPTQNPQAARAEVAKLLALDEANVTVNVTLLGGGFGRKSKADFVVEAAYLAKQMGVPVRLQWTREDDVRHGYYNAVNVQRLRAGLDDKGALVAWHHKTALTPIGNTMTGNVEVATAQDLQQGVLDVALSAPNVRAEACKARPHVRVGWYRSVYNIFHAFGVGSFIDELAHARKIDPRDMWLDAIGPAKIHSLEDLGIEKLSNYGEPLDKHPVDAGRLRNVIERVTDAAKWKDARGKGRALGLAAHRSFVSYVAVVVSVVADPARKIRIDEAWIAMDAGTVVNKDRVRAQCEGAVVMGISNALYGGITMNGGVTEQSNFRDARVARIGDVPRRIHVDLVASTAPPSGVGEPGVPPVAPAIANAIFALSGQRIREIPIAKALGV